MLKINKELFNDIQKEMCLSNEDFASIIGYTKKTFLEIKYDKKKNYSLKQVFILQDKTLKPIQDFFTAE